MGIIPSQRIFSLHESQAKATLGRILARLLWFAVFFGGILYEIIPRI
jgi:hypothetical protein